MRFNIIRLFYLQYPHQHILRRNCLLQRVIEGKIKGGIEVTGRRGRRRRKLLDDLKERRGYSHLKEETLDRTMWRARFGRGFGPVVRQTIEWMNVPFRVYAPNYITMHGFVEVKNSFIHSFSILSYDRSKASSKASSPHSAIQSFLFQMRVSSPFLKVIQ